MLHWYQQGPQLLIIVGGKNRELPCLHAVKIQMEDSMLLEGVLV